MTLSDRLADEIKNGPQMGFNSRIAALLAREPFKLLDKLRNLRLIEKGVTGRVNEP